MTDTKIKPLTTPYFSELDEENPWSDYPRPQFVRESFLSLNGLWDFEAAKRESVPRTYSRKILVPFPPESTLSGLGISIKPGERLYYRRTFTLPDGFKKSRVILHIGAADQICAVVINGSSLGAHEGGYLPFSADITDCLSDGENEIVLKAVDDMSPVYPMGKQKRRRGGMWYTPVSGVWQSVWLESVPENAIEGITITPTMESAKIEVRTKAKNKKLTIKETGEVYTFEGSTVTVRPENPKLWSPESPHLYYFTLETETDRIESYFALRKIDIKTVGGIKRLCLNGKPYLFHGLLDQGYFPDGIYLPATARGYEEDILRAKELGFNMLRKHIKVEPLIFYHLCDKLGMVVFQDMVNNSTYSFISDTALPTLGLKKRSDKDRHKNPKSRAMFERCMYETASVLYNSPSVLYYTVFNEGWGQFLADEAFEKLKKADPTRIIDATSGWFWQKDSDVLSEHIYFKNIKPHTPAERPTVISEFGGYSHRVEGHTFSKNNYGYKSFKERKAYEDAVISLYEEQVLPTIKGGVCALVYTQLSDVEDETNGLITYDRRTVKVDAGRMREMAEKLKNEIT